MGMGGADTTPTATEEVVFRNKKTNKAIKKPTRNSDVSLILPHHN